MTSVVFRDHRRGEAVDLLAGSLFDLLHMPETWTGNIVRTARKREGREARNTVAIPCPACGHTKTPGWLIDKFRRRQPCETCGGRPAEHDERGKQTRPAKKGTGRVLADQYVLAETGDTRQAMIATEAGTLVPLTRSWPCNVCPGDGVEPKRRGPNGERIPCRACNGRGRREISPFVLRYAEDPNDPDVQQRRDPTLVVERAIDARDQAGDYHPLERALAELRRKDRPAHLVFWQTLVVFELRDQDLDPLDRRRLDRARRFLLARMPAEIRVPRWVLDNERERRKHPARVRGRGADSRALAERDQAIRDRDRAGVPVDVIAAEFGLSRSRVYAILRRSERSAA